MGSAAEPGRRRRYTHGAFGECGPGAAPLRSAPLPGQGGLLQPGSVPGAGSRTGAARPLGREGVPGVGLGGEHQQCLGLLGKPGLSPPAEKTPSGCAPFVYRGIRAVSLLQG